MIIFIGATVSGVKRGAACVAPVMDLVAPYSQKTGTEQPLDLTPVLVTVKFYYY